MTTNWNQKGAALSDKTARREYGLTQDEIIAAIQDGKLQYRNNHVHGNPYLRLLRSEVESLLKELRGAEHVERQKLETELKSVSSQIRSYKMKLTQLENTKAEIMVKLEEQTKRP